jgi:hypothetical protein
MGSDHHELMSCAMVNVCNYDNDVLALIDGFMSIVTTRVERVSLSKASDRNASLTFFVYF